MITKSNVIGWALTILISVSGAWGAVKKQQYDNSTEIEKIKIRISILEKRADSKDARDEKVNSDITDIKIGIATIIGEMKLKKDKE